MRGFSVRPAGGGPIMYRRKERWPVEVGLSPGPPHGHSPETRTSAEADHRTRMSLHVSMVVAMTLKGAERQFSHRVSWPTHNDPCRVFWL